jgi:sugar lactone lactonase YvrE
VTVSRAAPPALQGAASQPAACASRAIPFPQDALVGAGDGFWLACRERGALVHLDGAGHATATVPLPGVRPWALAAADGSLWVVDRDRPEVLRLDAATGAVERRIQLPARATYVFAGAGAAWVALDELSAVVRIAPRTNAAGAPVGVGSGPSGFATDGRTVWVACHRDASLWAIEDGKARRLAPSLAGGEAAPERAAFAGGSLWLTGRGVDLLRLDPATGQVRQTIEIGPAGIDVVAAGDTVWVASATPVGARRGDPLVARLIAVDAASGAITASRTASNGLSLTGRGVSAGQLWLADALHGLLLHLPARP